MSTLTDYIEEYLKKLLALSSRSYVDIRRQELARKFSCVPSQINYVLRTRFTLERGYLVESRRGGSGYIRIYKAGPRWVRAWDLLNQVAVAPAADGFEPDRAVQYLKRFCDEKVISRREARMIEELLCDDHYSGLEKVQIRRLQHSLFKAVLAAAVKEG